MKFLHTKLNHPCLYGPTLDYADRRDNKDSLFGMNLVTPENSHPDLVILVSLYFIAYLLMLTNKALII